MDSKKVFEKLVKIADNQQKIINKMAQALHDAGLAGPEQLGGGSADWYNASAEVVPVVQEATKAVNAKNTYNVQSADFGKSSGTLRVKLQYPMSQLGSQEAQAVETKSKEMLTGKNIAGTPVRTVEVIGVTV